MKKQHIRSLLNSRVQAVSTNTLDGLVCIQVNDKWFVLDEDPTLLFGTPDMHDERTT